MPKKFFLFSRFPLYFSEFYGALISRLSYYIIILYYFVQKWWRISAHHAIRKCFSCGRGQEGLPGTEALEVGYSPHHARWSNLDLYSIATEI